jgi:hypothetical protein
VLVALSAWTAETTDVTKASAVTMIRIMFVFMV